MQALEPGYELISCSTATARTSPRPRRMAQRIGALAPGVEVEVRHGGQPLYRYLISAE